MATRTTLYFAFGSNTDRARMTARVPRAVLVGAAFRPDRELAFHGRPTPWARRPGVANLVTRPGATAWGALYRLPEDALPVLDGYEGVPTVYQRRLCWVYLQGAGAARCAWCYTMEEHQGAEAPAADYVAYIRRGYVALRLPEEALAAALAPFARAPVAYETWTGYAPR